MTAEADLVRAIREAGREPVQRNTFYEPIRVWGARPETDAAHATHAADRATPQATAAGSLG